MAKQTQKELYLKRVSMARYKRELSFIEEYVKTGSIKEAAKKSLKIGSRMDGEITPERLDKAAHSRGHAFYKNLSDRAKEKLIEKSDKAINKLDNLLSAKKGVYFQGMRVGEDDDNGVQFQAAKSILEMAGMKPKDKESSVNISFHGACVKIVETDDEGRIIGDDVVEGELISSDTDGSAHYD